MTQQNLYSISIHKEYFNFSASHFVIFKNGEREPLHGHNYRVRVKAHSFKLDSDMVMDFLDIKPIVRNICNELDHLFLVPKLNPYLTIETSLNEKSCRLVINKEEEFIIPKKDMIFLPIENTTAERLSIYLANRIQEEIFQAFGQKFPKLEVEVEETVGQSAIYQLELEN